MKEQTNILTIEEKNWFLREIYCYGNGIKSITKLPTTIIGSNCTYNVNFLLKYNKSEDKIINSCSNYEHFQNMEIGKEYTIEELGLQGDKK